jgi:hypothetical protein
MATPKWQAKKVYSTAAILALSAGMSVTVLGADTINTRNPDAAQADLMRDWNAKPAAKPGSVVRSRNQQNANSDLKRDFGAKSSSEPGKALKQRSEDAKYKDMVRDWSPGEAPAASKTAKAAHK